MREREHGEQGASAVEFALILPLLLLLVFGIIQFGLVFFGYQGLQASAREGARFASRPEATTVEADQRVRSSTAFDSTTWTTSCPVTGEGQICITWTPNQAQPCKDRSGETVAVDVSIWFSNIVPMVPWNGTALTASGQFRCE